MANKSLSMQFCAKAAGIPRRQLFELLEKEKWIRNTNNGCGYKLLPAGRYHGLYAKVEQNPSPIRKHLALSVIKASVPGLQNIKKLVREKHKPAEHA